MDSRSVRSICMVAYFPSFYSHTKIGKGVSEGNLGLRRRIVKSRCCDCPSRYSGGLAKLDDDKYPAPDPLLSNFLHLAQEWPLVLRKLRGKW
ncbi:hypothetical protein NPIL_516741 [Nephila pilipes]|uniref:Uncharacterized protein n=1 Tax=Nephila pilipes TaxID=299642 RepID=A0A8X6TVA2_NEPPI|nr:hypothetical protein NPIL_516741 [Nephila pilipes]